MSTSSHNTKGKVASSLYFGVKHILSVSAIVLVLTCNIAEARFASYIPGGFSPSRCMGLRGRAMTYAIFLFSGCAILFFGYDTAVMSQVNDNEDYLRRMGISSGSDRDAAAIGGLVSLWFGGFAIGMSLIGNSFKQLTE